MFELPFHVLHDIASLIEFPFKNNFSVQRVIDCALYIQEKYGSYLCKDVDITIRVKIGIGFGVVHFGGIGTEAYQHWIAYGPGVSCASAAEKHCSSGDIVLDPSAWQHCTAWHYKYRLKDQPFVHVTGIITRVNENKRGRPRTSSFATGMTKANLLGGVLGKKDSVAPPSYSDSDKIRPQIQVAVDRRPESIMRPFIIPPVLRKLDDDIPVEYLNESRVVCICFIHVKYDEKVEQDEKNYRENIATIVQRGFVKIYQNVTKLQGALSKVIMFDKGLTYLVVMGLPGYINENQSTHALKFAYHTRLALKAIKFVTEVSIGVTTGSCYCGVIGHPRRQEYTVIGRKVNKAARLMVHYPNRLTCDQDTAYFSKLPPDNFKLMEAKELKGLKDVGKIYEFVEADSGDDNSIPFFQYPLLGRDSELIYFKNSLKHSKKDLETLLTNPQTMASTLFRGIGQQDPSTQHKPIWMIIFEGENGIGKSRLLSACIQEAENMNNVRISTVGMNLATSSQAHYAISCLAIDALGMVEFRTVQEREEYLRKHVTDAELAGDLCLINDILHTKFPLHPKYISLDNNACLTYGQHVLYTLLRRTYRNELMLFVVDDAHLMDIRSWEYLVYISKFPNVFTLCSLRRSSAGSPKLADNVTKQIYHNRQIKIIRMNGVDENFLLPLACQIMQVRAIPMDLAQLIRNKSNGVPAWIDQVLNELLRTGILRLQKENSKQAMITADRIYLQKIPKNAKKRFRRWAALDDGDDGTGRLSRLSDLQVASTAAVHQKEEQVNPLERVLVIKSDTNIHSVPVSGTLKEILLDAYDDLNPNEQIILKAASTLGVRFSRKMLTKLLPFYDDTWTRKYLQGIVRLFEAKYFRCASATPKQKEKASAINAKPECFCKEEDKSSSSYMAELEALGKMVERRPKHYSCRFLEFTKENMVEVVYDLMNEDHRMEFHLKAAKYLDSSQALCESCGGEDRSYAFGFVHKSNDYATEDALRLAAEHGQPRRKSKVVEREILRRQSNVSYYSGEKHRRTLVTQLECVKRSFDAGGTKMGAIQLEIIRGLVEFDRELQLRNKRTCMDKFCCRSSKSFGVIEEEEELQKFQQKENENIQNELELTDDDAADYDDEHHNDDHILFEPNNRGIRHSVTFQNPTPVAATASAAEEGVAVVDQMQGSQNRGSYAIGGNSNRNAGKSMDSSSRGNSSFMMDLRTCQCAIIQAKICVEMVFHYREAKKYGRCLQNLLDAAESDVTVGNGSQALVHIEDAVGLLNQVKNGDLPSPDKNDQDDTIIDAKEAEAQIEFLSGLAYFEIGVKGKAREYFLKALSRLGLVLHYEDSGMKRDAAILRAKIKLCKVRNCGCCYNVAKTKINKYMDETWQKKIRILTYLHSLFKIDKKIEMALLVTLWQVILAEQYGEIMRDVIPAYSNLMDIYGALTKYSQARHYEKLSLELIRGTVGSLETEPVGLVTSANLFMTIAAARLNRGEIESSSKAACLALNIAQSIHDNLLIIRILPLLCQSLLLSLRISEVAEALQKLWFLSEEADDWTGVSSYYSICLDLLLNTAYPLEQFGVCENFIVNSDWSTETSMYRDFEVQYSVEASLALWNARYSRWIEAQKWFHDAESNRPKNHSYFIVSADLKLLECQLIYVNHLSDSKVYKEFSEAKNRAKELMRNLTKAIAVVPVLKPRFNHLTGYYYRLRSRNVEAEKYLKQAEKRAAAMGNYLEQEFVTHSRNVWAEMAIPTLKFFWLEHTENHTLDWHSSGKIPWANIMYSLPISS